MGRDTIASYDLNRAPSWVPYLYWDPDKGTFDSIETLIDKNVIKAEAGLKQLKKLKEPIKDHVIYRIQIFAQQLLIFYKAGGNVFGDTSAKNQLGQIKGVGGNHNACHSSTLNGFKNYMTTSNYYAYTWNATCLLPRIVNDIDCDLDWRSTNLRTHSAQILQEVSDKEYDVTEGLKRFLKAAIYSTKAIMERKKGKQQSKEELKKQQLILDIYLKVFEKTQKLLEKNPMYLKLIFGVKKLNKKSVKSSQKRINKDILVQEKIKKIQDKVLSPFISKTLPKVKNEEKDDYLMWLTTFIANSATDLTKKLKKKLKKHSKKEEINERKIRLLMLTNSKLLSVSNKYIAKLEGNFKDWKKITKEFRCALQACFFPKKKGKKADKQLKIFKEIFSCEPRKKGLNKLPKGISRGEFMLKKAPVEKYKKCDRSILKKFFKLKLAGQKPVLYRILYELSHKYAQPFILFDQRRRYQFELDHLDKTAKILKGKENLFKKVAEFLGLPTEIKGVSI